jgi:hypothetical protein
MSYSVKVNFGHNLSLEVVGDDIAVVAALLNESTKKFFPTIPSSKIEI